MKRKKPYSVVLLFAAGKRSLQVFSKISAVTWQNWNYRQGTTARQQDKSVLLQNDLKWWNNLIDCAAGLYQSTWLQVRFSFPFSLHPESKASSKLLPLVEKTFFFFYILVISTIVCFATDAHRCLWHLLFSLGRCAFCLPAWYNLATSFHQKGDPLFPGCKSGITETGESHTTCFNTAQVSPPALAFLLNSSWIWTPGTMFI